MVISKYYNLLFYLNHPIQCGIILGSIILYLNSIMTKLCCHQLIKSSLIARRRNYEVLGNFLV